MFHYNLFKVPCGVSQSCSTRPTTSANPPSIHPALIFNECLTCAVYTPVSQLALFLLAVSVGATRCVTAICGSAEWCGINWQECVSHHPCAHWWEKGGLRTHDPNVTTGPAEILEWIAVDVWRGPERMSM